MRTAIGLKAHSGWSALVVLGAAGSDYCVIDRRRIELVEEAARSWAAQPYHAAERADPAEAQQIVIGGIEAARRIAVEQVQVTANRLRESHHEIVASAVLVPEPMPDWTTDQILAVHFRMHKAEGALFPDALARAARTCGLRVVAVREKLLWQQAESELALSSDALTRRIAALGKAAGSPWGKDQKSAALAAMIALGKSDNNDAGDEE
jgi:hypothetical protein